MRCRGGKCSRSTHARGVLDDVYPDSFVTATQTPDRRTINIEALRQLLHDGHRVRHGQQDPSASSDALLGTSVANEIREVGRVGDREVDDVRRVPSHLRGVATATTTSKNLSNSPLVRVGRVEARLPSTLRR